MFNKKAKKDEVYSSTDLSDLLSSPVFYSVIALTFILGVSSIFGFFNNPRKLKLVVDVLSQKLLITPNSNAVSFDVDEDYLRRNYSLKSSSLKIPRLNTPLFDKLSNKYFMTDPYSLSTNIIDYGLMAQNTTQRVSFDYDITSKQFWGNLDASSIESAIEESLRKSVDATLIGAPLSPEYYIDGDSKYSMGAGLLRL